MSSEYQNNIKKLLSQDNRLLSFQITKSGEIIESNREWTGNIKDYIDENSFDSLTLNDTPVSLNVNNLLFEGETNITKEHVYFLGKSTTNKTNQNIKLSNEGEILGSNHQLFKKGQLISEIEFDKDLSIKINKSFKYCLEKRESSGFEVSDLENLNRTIYYHFKNEGSYIELTIESLDFSSDNSLYSTYFEQILDNSSDFMYKCNVEGYFVYTNKTMRDRYGIKGTGNTPFTHWIREDYKDLVQRFYADQIRAKTPVTYLEFPTVTSNNEEIWIGQNVQLVTLGNWVLGVQATSRDITENKLIEHELIEIQGKNQAILDSIPDSIFVIDKNLHIYDRKIVSNAGFLSDPTVNNLRELIKNEPFISKLEFSCKIAYEYKTTQKIELIHKYNNTEVHFDVRLTNIDEEKTLLIFRNITETKIHENNLKLAQEKERTALKAKQRYLSFMSHEIRTPLNAIIGLNDLLLDTSPSSKQMVYLKNIKSSSSILSKIINDVLDFNKLESENIQVENRKFNIKKLSKEVINSCLVYSYGKPVELFLEIEENTPLHLAGDSFKITQILTNLIGNALKFTQKGEVKLSISKTSSTKETCKIKFIVSDTGIGIPEDKLPNIFDSYEQVDASISRKFGGTGLGLTITKKFIELLGGKIEVSSVFSEGTNFSFELDLDISEAEETYTKVQMTADLSSNSILLVEDNEMNQLIMSKYFTKWGVNYNIVDNGQEALNKIEEFEYQLIMLDLEMPVMDGFDTAWNIRNNENDNINSIPIIAISASMFSEVEERLNSLGVNDFIPKPFNADHVYSILAKYLAKNESKLEKAIEIDDLMETGKSYDLTYLIESSLNDMTYINKMIELFTSKSPGYLKEMRELYDNSKLDELKKVAHKYRASIAIMGIKKAEKTIINIEDNIVQNKDIHSIDSLLSSLEKDIKKACQEITEAHK